MSIAVEARGLGKRYRRRWALSDCTLSIPSGRVTGLVGPNTEDAIDDLAPDATPADHQAGQPEHGKHHWRLWFGPAD